MRRDRDGSPIDDEAAEHDCRRGWIGEGLNVKPCRICKPHLFEHTPPQPDDEAPATAESMAAARQHLREVLGWR